VSDRGLASELQAVLIIKSGSDVFAFGVMDTPEALTTTTALAQAVMAGSRLDGAADCAAAHSSSFVPGLAATASVTD